MLFKGFNEKGIQFLKDLAANNNKPWFELNRNIYDEYLLKPMKELATDLGPLLKSIDPEIETTPVIDKTISRIYRDIRFSSDKSPYRADLWLSFKRPVKLWGNVPEFYFYFSPEEYQYGMGFYSATPASMQKIRSYTVSFPERFMKIMDYYNSQKVFVLAGDEYKKHIVNPLPPVYQSWFRKKNLYTNCTKKIDRSFFSVSLKEELEEAVKVNTELYNFLTDSINL